MFNAMYADREGNIFYIYNGAVPKRATQFDWSKPVDGSNPATEWQGYHSFDELITRFEQAVSGAKLVIVGSFVVKRDSPPVPVSATAAVYVRFRLT